MSGLDVIRGRRRRRSTISDDQRRRVRRACVPCRSNKVKCDRSTPCSRCVTHNSTCYVTDNDQEKDPGGQLEKEHLLRGILSSQNIQVPSDLDGLRDFAKQLQGDRSIIHAEAMSIPRNLKPDKEDVYMIVNGNPQTYVHDQGRTCRCISMEKLKRRYT